MSEPACPGLAQSFLHDYISLEHWPCAALKGRAKVQYQGTVQEIFFNISGPLKWPETENYYEQGYRH